MALTGGSPRTARPRCWPCRSGKQDINAKGGLLGRPVKLIYYDDQSNPATIPGLYTKLLDVDKVDLIICGYGTNMIAPAMPIIIQHKRTFLSLLELAVNTEFNYPNYFSLLADRRTAPKQSFAAGLLRQVAKSQNPKPRPLAMVGADAEFPHNAMDGARELAKSSRAQGRLRPDLPADHDGLHPDRPRHPRRPTRTSCWSAPYPPDTVGIIRAANEIELRRKMFGGGMVGLQSHRDQDPAWCPLLNGIVDYDFWLPWAGPLATPEAQGLPQALPGEGGGRRRRCAGLSTCHRSPTP